MAFIEIGHKEKLNDAVIVSIKEVGEKKLEIKLTSGETLKFNLTLEQFEAARIDAIRAEQTEIGRMLRLGRS